jgi:hypothetical protein
MVSILLNLERIVNGSTSDNLTFIIIRSLVFGGMSKTDITNKVVFFGANGVIVFQGLKINVTVQLGSKHYHFVVGIHYMAL